MSLSVADLGSTQVKDIRVDQQHARANPTLENWFTQVDVANNRRKVTGQQLTVRYCPSEASPVDYAYSVRGRGVHVTRFARETVVHDLIDLMQLNLRGSHT